MIVGAGAAGLAAGQALRGEGVPFVILEGRSRIGGRVFTAHPRGLAVPVELGAEFTHGEAAEVMEVAAAANLGVVDISGRRFRATGKRLRVVDDFWEGLDRVMRRLDADREPDRSFEEAIARNKTIGAEERALALQYVRGFHAANPGIISERALAEGGSPGGDVRERRIGRVLAGYDAVVAALARGIESRIRLRAEVRAIEWKRGSVRVRLADGSAVRGRAVIVTVPIGVLAAGDGERGAVAFDPPIASVARAVSDLAMGGVVRVGLRFDEPFWTSKRFAGRAGDDRLDTLSFLHGASDVDFPVWWTSYPVRSPVLIAWCGGPASERLSGLSRAALESEALESLAALLPVTVARLRKHLVSSHTHDWIADPFSRGAYSYPRVGGDDAAARLGRPVEGTVFVAGEAADPEGRNGTVHGAIATGRRAARLLMAQ